jgi:CBS domain-containing protein
VLARAPGARRGEQTFATDQDNALLFSATDSTDAQPRRERLLAFAHEVNIAFDALGFPLCPGNVMASNPDLFLSMDEWKDNFLAWIREPKPQACSREHRLRFPSLYGNTRSAKHARVAVRLHAGQSDVPALPVQNALTNRRWMIHVRARREFWRQGLSISRRAPGCSSTVRGFAPRARD